MVKKKITACDHMVRVRGKLRPCNVDKFLKPVGTGMLPISKEELKEQGGQPKWFCQKHFAVHARKEVSILDGRARTSTRRD